MTNEQVKALFLLAGIPVEQTYEIKNQYWPDHPSYDSVRSPWWLVKTPAGLIEIGWRKRVISINWEGAKAVRAVVTEDDVTKSEQLVHAYSYAKAVEYLTELGRQMRAAQAVEQQPAAEAA